MIIEPQTNIRLLKCPLEADQNHQLTFANLAAQQAYFNGLPSLSVNGCTYQRKDGVLRFAANFDEAIKYNYCMYQNKEYSDKWFYAFITGMTYLGNEVVGVELKTDVFQTWQFDFVWKPCFVEREHVYDDTPGRHTIPEDVELGPYVQCTPTTTFEGSGNGRIAFQVSEIAPKIQTPSGYKPYAFAYNGIYSGLILFSVANATQAEMIINDYVSAGKVDAIQAIFMISALATQPYMVSDYYDANNAHREIYFYTQTDKASSITTPIQPITPTKLGKLSDSDEYKWTPKNNKLLTYPYCYLVGSNGVGENKIYHYEDFAARQASFVYAFAIGQGCSGIALPANHYKGNTSNDNDVTSSLHSVWDEGITFPKFPLCAWASDYYLNWLTQNAVNVPMKEIGSALQAAGNLFTGNIIGGAQSLFEGIGSVMSERYQAQLVPNETHGNPTNSDVAWGCKMSTVQYTGYSIKYEYAQVIDNFFTMFGYKVNSLQVPYINIRPNFDFCKTRGCIVEGNIPQNDLDEMKQIMDKGITFWHNPDTFLDYDQPNARV